MAPQVRPIRPQALSPLAQAFVAASVAGSRLVFIAPPPPPPTPIAEAAALGAALGGLLPQAEADLESWLAVLEVGKRAILRIAACDDQRARLAPADLAAAVAPAQADCAAWFAALGAVKPAVEQRQKTARAALVQIERTEGVIRANHDYLRRRTRLKVMRELQAGPRAAAGSEDGASQAQVAAKASADAGEALVRVRSAQAPALDAGAARALLSRAKAVLVAEEPKSTNAADPALIASRAQALWEATQAEIEAQLGRMRRLLGLEGEALRRQATLQQLAVEAHGHAVRALDLLARPGPRTTESEAEFAFALAASAEAGRTVGGAAAAYDSVVASAGYAEALVAAAAAVSAALARIGA